MSALLHVRLVRHWRVDREPVAGSAIAYLHRETLRPAHRVA